MTRHDTWKRSSTTGSESVPANPAIARNFSPAVVSSSLSGAGQVGQGGTKGGSRKNANSQQALAAHPGGDREGVQSVDIASGRERKCLVGEIRQRVHQPNHPEENSWMLEQFSRRRFPCGACVGSEELWPGNESSRLDGAAGDAARLPLTRSSRREGLAGLAGSVLVGWMVGH